MGRLRLGSLCALHSACLIDALVLHGLPRVTESDEACSFEVPASPPAGPDADARALIKRIFYSDEREMAALGDGNVTAQADRLGPRGPSRCQEVNPDGNCEVASCTEDTYGEMTQLGAAQMFANPHVLLKPGDTFVDLGSGFGRLVADAVILGGAGRAVGVELSHGRWQDGCQSMQNLADLLKSEQTTSDTKAPLRASTATQHLELRRGDMLRANVFSDADVVYVASLCFRPALLEQLQAVLVQQLRSGVRVVTLRRFVEPQVNQPASKKLVFQAMIRVGMDWNAHDDPQPVFVYRVESA